MASYFVIIVLVTLQACGFAIGQHTVQYSIDEPEVTVKLSDLCNSLTSKNLMRKTVLKFILPEMVKSCALQFRHKALTVQKLNLVIAVSDEIPESSSSWIDLEAKLNISRNDPTYIILIDARYSQLAEWRSESLTSSSNDITSVLNVVNKNISELDLLIFETMEKSCDLAMDSVLYTPVFREVHILLIFTIFVLIAEVVLCGLYLYRFSHKSGKADVTSDRRSLRRSMIDPYRDQLEDINRSSISDASKYVLSRTEVSVASPDPVGPVRLQSVVQV